MRRISGGVALVAVMLAGACREKAEAPAADSALAQDLVLAQREAVAPVFNDVPLGGDAPAARAPAARAPRNETRANVPAPRPTPRREQPPARIARSPEPAPQEPVAAAPQPGTAPAAAPAPGIIGSGSRVGMTSNGRVCTRALLPGDKFTATVTSGTVGSNGAAIPEGATVVLEVASVERADPVEASRIEFRVRSIEVNGAPQPVAGDVTVLGSMERVQESSNNDRQKVIGGAVAGAVLGRILGKSTKSTVIGAAAGAAAGTAAARTSQHADACLAQGSPMRLTITRDIVVRSGAI